MTLEWINLSGKLDIDNSVVLCFSFQKWETYADKARSRNFKPNIYIYWLKTNPTKFVMDSSMILILSF